MPDRGAARVQQYKDVLERDWFLKQNRCFLPSFFALFKLRSLTLPHAQKYLYSSV